MARAVELIVEDGTIVASANSFVTEQEIVTYAAMRGIALPFNTDPNKDAVAILGIQAADYLRILPWKGEVVDISQTMPWPRKNLYVTPSFPEDAVPSQVKEAQLMLALLAQNGTVLIPTWTGAGYLIKEKIGPIENTYSEKVGVSTSGLPILPGIQGLLSYWLLGDMDGFIPVGMWSIGDRTPYGS
jgi:hypothetical protein